TPALVTPELSDVSASLTESFGTGCCDTVPGLCAAGCTGCGPMKWLRPRATLTFTPPAPPDLHPYVRARAQLVGPGGYVLAHFPAVTEHDALTVRAVLDVPLDRYCFTLTVHHLVHGTAAETSHCVDASALPPPE